MSATLLHPRERLLALALCALPACAPVDGTPAVHVTTADAGAAADAATADAPASADAASDGAGLDGAGLDAGPPCGSAAPTRLWLTVNGLDEAMSGLEPGQWQGVSSTFHWAVPPVDWTLEVHMVHPPGWCPAGAPTLTWGKVGQLAPLADAAPTGSWQSTDVGHRWLAQVDAPLPGGLGMFRLGASLDGLNSTLLPLQVAERTVDIDPFANVDRWAILLSRDRGKLTVTYQGGKFAVATQGAPEPDGEADFVEALSALGLLGGDAAFNSAMLAWFRSRFIKLIREFYLLDPADGAIGADSVRVQILLEGDPGLPAKAKLAAEGWSQIAVGGEDPNYKPGGQTFFGRAEVDWFNQQVNDDTKPHLGVFTTAVVRMVLTNSAGAALLKGYAPASAGKPYGSQPGDADFLADDFDPEALAPGPKRSRGLQFKLVGRLLVLALASVTAHEMGHSLGLVRSGLPPQGMLADVSGPWAVQTVPGGHVDTPGFNLMQTGSSFSFADLASGTPRFAASNLGYLRRRFLMLK